MPLIVGIVLIVLQLRRRGRPRLSIDRQKVGNKREPVGIPLRALWTAQRQEMDAADRRVGRQELSPGKSEETRGILELEGS